MVDNSDKIPTLLFYKLYIVVKLTNFTSEMLAAKRIQASVEHLGFDRNLQICEGWLPRCKGRYVPIIFHNYNLVWIGSLPCENYGPVFDH